MAVEQKQDALVLKIKALLDLITAYLGSYIVRINKHEKHVSNVVSKSLSRFEKTRI